MNKEFIYNSLLNILNKEDILIDEPMSKHISFRVGGPADILVKPSSEDQIKDILTFAKKENIPYLIIGNGSNLLVRDGGIRGIVIKIAENFNDFSIEGTTVTAQSGAMLSFMGKAIMRNNLTGFEFAAGIPGTLGGAIAMNAGAYGGEMKDIVKSVRLIDSQGNIVELSNEEMQFAYRKSILSKEEYIVLSAVMELKEGNYEEIRDIMKD